MGGGAYLRGSVQMAPSLLTVPVVEDTEERPPPQMAPSAVTWLLSTTDLAPAFPPQMAPLVVVIDMGTGVSETPSALPLSGPQIADCVQALPHRMAVSWM